MTIYNNYNLLEDGHEEARACLAEIMELEEKTDEDILDTLYRWDEGEWDRIYGDILKHFGRASVIVCGYVGRWDGLHRGGQVFDNIRAALDSMLEDCAYIKIDDDGHCMRVECSHHDGSNEFEVRTLTEAGAEAWDAWNWDYNDTRTASQVITDIFDSDELSSAPDLATLYR